MKTLPGRWIIACAILSACAVSTYSQPYTLSTLAGSPASQGAADGTNSAAQFTDPFGLAVDGAGNAYVMDANAVRRISPVGTNWVVATLAGTMGQHGPNDGTNGAARFDYAQGLAVDGAGNIYVADTSNNALRKVAPVGTNWVVTTIAGVLGRMNSGASDGTNGEARFYQPYGIAVDAATNLFVADSGNNTIRKATPVGTNWVVTTLAGLAHASGSADGTNSAARFNGPAAVAVDAAGALYVADFGNDTVRKLTVSGTNWVVTTLAGLATTNGAVDGLGSAARFNEPQGIAADLEGNLYVTDSGNSTIRKITPAGLVSTIAGLAGASGTVDGTGSAARLNSPYGIAVDSSRTLYEAEYSGYTVRRGQIAPLMRLALSGNRAVLSWPTGLPGFVPQSCLALSNNPAWSLLPTNGLVSGADYLFLSNNIQPGAVYYRLHR